MKHLFRSLALGFVIPALALAVGCAEAPTLSSPEEAGVAPQFSRGGGGPDLGPLARYNQPPTITIAWAKKWIGPEGGRLDFQGFAIEVPPGAVSRVTQFSIRLPVDPQGAERVMAEFGPHGATFKLPVFIEFPYEETSIEGSESSQVIWWNGAQWVGMGGALTSDGKRLRTTTDHFSTYGTSDNPSRGILTSGG